VKKKIPKWPKKPRLVTAKGLGPAYLTVTNTVIVALVDQFPRRVARQCARLGTTKFQIAADLGVSHARLAQATYNKSMTATFFERLCHALQAPAGSETWIEELPELFSPADGAQVSIARARRLAGRAEK
jgi:transcriptional regulator with XRE-family HTH domain